VKGDQLVRQGDQLARLENHELEQEWQKVFGQIRETTERLDSLQQAKKNSRGLTEAQLAQISGEYVQLSERAKSLQIQKRLVEQKRKNLIVRSPIDGQVMLPWDAEQSLMHRPVVTGQRVMTIADPSQDWELELAMPERRMGHVTRAVDEFGPNLDVSYISAGILGRPTMEK